MALSVSYLELVNEELRDLLQPKEEREELRVPRGRAAVLVCTQ